MGSSGVSGELTFPVYIEETHKAVMARYVGDAVTGVTPGHRTFDQLAKYVREDEFLNPYALVEYADPREDLDTVDLTDLRARTMNYQADPRWVQSLMRVRQLLVDEFPWDKLNTLSRHDILRGRVNTLMGTTFSAELDEVLNYDTIFQKATALAENLEGVDVDAALGKTLGLVPEILREVLTVAQEAILTTEVGAIITAFETRQAAQLGRALQQFNAGMADINAVHSSAFMFGQALIQSDAQAEAARFQGELRQRIFEQAISLQTGFHTGYLQVIAQLEAQNQGTQQQLILSSAQLMSSLLGTKKEVEVSLRRLFVEAFSAQFRTLLEIETAQSNQRNALYQQNVQVLMEGFQNEVALRNALVQTQTEFARIKHVLSSEYEGNMVDLDVHYVKWNLDLFEQAANVLSAPSGMAGRLPPGPSKMQTAAGGAMMGAGIGGRIAGAPGMGVGAVLGGLAGLLT